MGSTAPTPVPTRKTAVITPHSAVRCARRLFNPERARRNTGGARQQLHAQRIKKVAYGGRRPAKAVQQIALSRLQSLLILDRGKIVIQLQAQLLVRDILARQEVLD